MKKNEKYFVENSKKLDEAFKILELEPETDIAKDKTEGYLIDVNKMAENIKGDIIKMAHFLKNLKDVPTYPDGPINDVLKKRFFEVFNAMSIYVCAIKKIKNKDEAISEINRHLYREKTYNDPINKFMMPIAGVFLLACSVLMITTDAPNIMKIPDNNRWWLTVFLAAVGFSILVRSYWFRNKK